LVRSIFIVTKKDDIAIVPVRITSLTTTNEFDDYGNIAVSVSYKVASGSKTYNLNDIKGSQFSTVDDAIASLKTMWDKKLATMRHRALAAAKQAFDYEPEKDMNNVNLDSPVFDDASHQDAAENTRNLSSKNTAEIVAEPDAPKMKIDMSSIDAAFKKQHDVNTMNSTS